MAIPFEELPELGAGTDIFSLLIMTRKHFIDDLYTSNKTRLGSLSSYFLPVETLSNIKTSLKDFQSNINNIVRQFITEDQIDGRKYMLKADADAARKNVMTEEKLDSMMRSYVKTDQLSVDLKEVEENSYNLVNSYIANIMGPASSIKFGATNQKGLSDLETAIGNIKLSGS